MTFDQELTQTESVAARRAERIIKAHFEMLEYPRPDQHDVLRHGWNRPIQRRPKTVQAADFELRSDLQHARQVLHGRVFALVAKIQFPAAKLAALYAIADLLSAEHVRDWEPLWHALESQSPHQVMHELLLCNWTKLVGSTPVLKELFAKVTTILVSDQVPDEFA